MSRCKSSSCSRDGRTRSSITTSRSGRSCPTEGPTSRCTPHILLLHTGSAARLLIIHRQLPQCDVRKGYDPLLELPDGRKREVEPGYERPQRGPTTNFVGNHMTQVRRLACTAAQHLAGLEHNSKPVLWTWQGAIDMVQMQLGKPDTEQQQLLAWHDDAVRAPELLSAGPAAATLLPEAVQSYSWQDHGQHVELHIPAHSYVPGKSSLQSTGSVAR